MRVLLVHAAFPTTYWGFQHVMKLTGHRASMPPLGLVTVAAHLPVSWTLKLVDMNIEPLRDEDLRWADVVLVGGMLIQSGSMREVIARARAAGRRTVVGGPAATTSPELFREAQVVFGGEIEGRADELIAALVRPSALRTVLATSKDRLPDMSLSRVPRYDLLDLGAYSTMPVQYSRGCPFTCEFCDVIEVFGRRPRVKTTEQVLAELTALYDLGWRGTLFIVDDNFIGNLREVRKLLPALRRWQEERRYPLELYTEASLNLAREPAVAREMVAAGFSSVFVGIETPSARALAEAGKGQNLRMPLDEAVAALTREGLEVMAGFIVGFDSDGPEVFAAQRQFLAAAPIPMAMLGLLIALPGTALCRRLAREGRLRESSGGDQFERPNFEPRMDEAVLLEGYARLLGELYDPEAYLARCMAFLRMAPTPPKATRVRPGGVRILARAALRLGLLGRRRRHFWSLLARACWRSPRFASWAVAHALQGEHFYRYTQEDVLPRVRASLGALERERARASEADRASA